MLTKTARVAFFIALLSLSAIVAAGCPQAAKKPNNNPVPQENAPKPEVPGGKEPTITLYMNDTGEKKEMPLEEYLKGVVAAEMDTSWPMQALAAQAILARTFTMKKIEGGGVEKYGTDASTSVEEFQAYDPEKINDQVEKAVEKTRGEVATYKGNYINGWFFADAGGKTAASAEEGLAYTEEPAPYIKSVEDPGFEITEEDNKSWTAKFSLGEVAQAVQSKTGQDPGSINEVKVTKKGPSGRAMTVKVGNVSVSGPALRLALGSTEMRSTQVESMAVEGGQLVIKGKGYGHGVGMSQWGARALAEQGKKAEEIVKYFFKDIDIQKVWE